MMKYYNLYIEQTSRRTFACVVCDKHYSCHRELEDHSWHHTGRKLHECHICKMKLTSDGSLRCHQLICTQAVGDNANGLSTVDELEVPTTKNKGENSFYYLLNI